MEAAILKTNASDEYYFEEGCYILEYSNSDTDPGLSIARARLTPKTETKLHKLYQTVERYIILQGEGKVILGNKQNNQLTESKVEAGDIVIIPENCPQAIRNIGQDDLIFLVICTPRFSISNYIEN